MKLPKPEMGYMLKTSTALNKPFEYLLKRFQNFRPYFSATLKKRFQTTLQFYVTPYVDLATL